MVFVRVYYEDIDKKWKKAGEGEYSLEREEFDYYDSYDDDVVGEDDVVYYLINYYPEEKIIEDIGLKIVVED